MSWTTPPTWTAGQIAGVSSGLQILSDDLALIGGAWATWAPTVGGLTTTSGTLVSVYKQIDKTVLFAIQFTFGASSSVASGITFTLPVTAARSGWYTGDCGALDSSAATDFPLIAKATSTTVLSLRAFPTTAGNALTGTGTNTPFTWATSDVLSISGRYEAA